MLRLFGLRPTGLWTSRNRIKTPNLRLTARESWWWRSLEMWPWGTKIWRIRETFSTNIYSSHEILPNRRLDILVTLGLFFIIHFRSSNSRLHCLLPCLSFVSLMVSKLFPNTSSQPKVGVDIRRSAQSKIGLEKVLLLSETNVKRRGQRLPTSNLRTQVLEGCMNLADSWETWRLYD